MKQFSTLKTKKNTKKNTFFLFQICFATIDKNNIFTTLKKRFGGKTHDISTLKNCSIENLETMGLDEFIPYSFFSNIDKRATNYNFCPQLSHHTKVLFCGSKGDLNKEKKWPKMHIHCLQLLVLVLSRQSFTLKIASTLGHGLRTPNEGINHRYLKNWADVADKICFGRT